MFASAFAGLSRVANFLAMSANVLGTLMVLALVAILNLDVIARSVFSAPIPGVYEMVQFSVVMIVFLQLADVVRVDRLTRSDGLLTVLRDKKPKLAQNMRRIINAVSAIFMGLVAYITFPEFLEMWHTQDYFGVPGLFTLPWWPVKLVISFGTALSCIIFVIKVISAQDRPELVHMPEHETTPK